MSEATQDKTREVKSKSIFAISKEVNRQSSEILDYLKRIGVEVAGVMSKIDDSIYKKVLSHFKSDIEEAEKHKQKLIEFKKKHKSIEIVEIEDVLQKEREIKLKEEEEKKRKKEIEEQKKRERDEQRRRELEESKKLIESKKKEIEKNESEKEAEKEKTKLKEPEKLKEEKKEISEEKRPLKETETYKIISKEKTEPIKAIGKMDLDKLNSRIKADKYVKRVSKKKGEKTVKKKPEEKITQDKPKRKFERVTIKEDFKRPPKRHIPHKIKPATKKSKREDVEGKENKEEKKTDELLSPEAEEKRRDLDKKNKSKKLKYTDGAELKKKKKYDEAILDSEIEDAIRETLAKIDDSGQLSTRALLRKKKKKERIELEQKQQEETQAKQNVLQVTEFLSATELALLMQIDVNQVIQKCFGLGMMVTINQRLDRTLIELLADEFGYKIEFHKEYESDVLADIEDSPSDLVARPPVVTIMGHVDHGKTSLLDYIRKANVVAGEAGGITQHIGAYQVHLDNGKLITFLDTPGHEAFTAMRARGAQITDIVVLVVAADDNVMPQTIEAINHSLAANVPIIIAINKIDKPNADINKIKTQLADKGILIEEWGGKYQSVEISAKAGLNIDQLLEKILLEAEILDLKANSHRMARGVIVEAKLDRGKGITASVLVQKGTLKTGDPFIAGLYSGKVKAMFDERLHRTEVAKSSTPVQVLGFDGMPQAGDVMIVLDSEKEAKEIALKRQQLKREEEFRQIRFTTLDDISEQIKKGKQVDLNVIIKGDVDGSVEALSDSLLKLGSNEVKVNVIHRGIGEISENDVLLAAASSAIIFGFNVRPNLKARKTAQTEKVDIRLHNIIYDVINEVRLALEGLLEPDKEEKILATVEVRNTFKVPKIGLIAGCYVLDGKISRSNKIRLIRDGMVVFEGNILSLKRFKDDVREVESGYECGIGLENFNDLKVGDVIESYTIIEIKRKLT